MRILYVAPQYDYGKPEQGYSFEHNNFYDFLSKSGHELIYFDFLTLLKDLGKERMNSRLLETVNSERPELMFTVLFTDEFDPATVKAISENTNTTTVNWFCDDHWRFENYSRHWAPWFNWVITTAASAIPKYADIGYQNVIKSQWACNHFSYKKIETDFKYDVTFVGQPHGNRRQIIACLKQNGIDVQTFGAGWEAGRVSQDSMIRIFNESRINLNLSNASIPLGGLQNPLFKPAMDRLARALDTIPFGPSIKKAGREVMAIGQNPGTSINTGKQYFEQIKGRNFEVPGCGGFLLAGNVEDLESYYEIGKEVVCFDDNKDLIEKIKYYLAHGDERAAIAQRGYERTIRDHTYARRFEDIFGKIGLTNA